jgi:hypothetical protein
VRNSFISVARAILAQLLHQHPQLLSFFYEMASTTDPTALTSAATARNMLNTAIGSCSCVYIIVDGLDECEVRDRKDISSWLRAAAQTTDAVANHEVRCFVTSQDDENARTNLKGFNTIKMTTENHKDLRRFTIQRYKSIERRFGGKLRAENRDLANTIFARAQGIV